jgi:hypothetical protein
MAACLLRLWVQIPLETWDVCLLWVLCVVRYGSLPRADRSSRGVLPTVMCCCVCSINLKNEEAMARVGPQWLWVILFYISDVMLVSLFEVAAKCHAHLPYNKKYLGAHLEGEELQLIFNFVCDCKMTTVRWPPPPHLLRMMKYGKIFHPIFLSYYNWTSWYLL